MKIVSALVLGLALSASVTGVSAGESRGNYKPRDNKTTTLFRLMGKNTIWTPVQTVSMNFPTFHTQGLVKIGDTFFVSSVEVLESTVRNGAATDSLYDFTIDRSTGNGRGWLFKFNAAGQLLGKVELTDGTMFHPGGIDYDGRFIWVPVAEYRPNFTVFLRDTSQAAIHGASASRHVRVPAFARFEATLSRLEKASALTPRSRPRALWI